MRQACAAEILLLSSSLCLLCLIAAPVQNCELDAFTAEVFEIPFRDLLFDFCDACKSCLTDGIWPR